MFRTLILGVSLTISLFFVFSLHFKSIHQKYRIRKIVKKRASEENRQFLIDNLLFFKFNKTDGLKLLFIPGAFFLLVGLMPLLSNQIVQSFAIIFFLGLVLAHIVPLISGVKEILDVLKFHKHHPDLLTVSNFLTNGEVHLLFQTKGTEKVGRHEVWDVPELEVYAPDILVPCLKNRKEIQKYLAVSRKVEDAIGNRESYMTVEQQKRNAKLKREFQESIRKFEPLFQLMMKSTNVVQVEDVRSNVEKALDESEAELRELNQSGSTSMDFDTFKPAPFALQDLKRVQQSESVSTELKERAGVLIQKITDIHSDEKRKNEQVSAEWEASAVIKASEQFYHLNDLLSKDIH